MRIFLSAGEASGDLYGAQLVQALRGRLREGPVAFVGLGGEAMRQAGCETIVDANDVAVVGLWEVVKHLPGIRDKFHQLLRAVDKQKPDIAILIDFPDFNLRLARELHKRDIPVVYFISPQLWAWRKGRIKQIQKYVRKMIVIFPFEEQFYRDHGVDVEFVGHPLADREPVQPLRLAGGRPYIALLPGSRRQEVERHIKVMLQSACDLKDAYDFVIPIASTLEKKWVEEQAAKAMKEIGKDLPLHFTGSAPETLAGAHVSVVASGTATVEAALAGNPFVVIYKVAPISYAFGRHLVKLPHYAMVNIIADKRIVPELIQDKCMAGQITRHLSPLIKPTPERQGMMEALAQVRQKLRGGAGAGSAIERAARSIQALLQHP